MRFSLQCGQKAPENWSMEKNCAPVPIVKNKYKTKTGHLEGGSEQLFHQLVAFAPVMEISADSLF
jgi:hypothetical protein